MSDEVEELKRQIAELQDTIFDLTFALRDRDEIIAQLEQELLSNNRSS